MKDLHFGLWTVAVILATVLVVSLVPSLGDSGAQISPLPTYTPTPVVPTNTPAPPTNTPAPPTNTPASPTNTPAPPTNTPPPPTNTPVPPTPTYTPVPNFPPELTVDVDTVTVNEGQVATNSGTATDPDGDALTLTASVGTITTSGDTWSWSFATSDGPAESQHVSIAADDGNGASGYAAFSLVVNNVAPQVQAIIIDPLAAVVAVDTAIDFTGVFTDPAPPDDAPYTFAFDYQNDGLVDETFYGITGNTLSASHAYTEPGVYTALVTVTDKDGDTGTSEFQYVVAYDPDAGFVTGGGWIDSPAGAYTPDPTLTGRATYGFVSKYKKGAHTPAGQTAFRFSAADLDFSSDTYEWLVIAGAKAMYKGTGTINGAGSYSFVLTAIDADQKRNDPFDTDRFRMRIWDASGKIYDNQAACTDQSNSADPCTEIGGGNIKIHKGK